jgi:hypothetical protein
LKPMPTCQREGWGKGRRDRPRHAFRRFEQYPSRLCDSPEKEDLPSARLHVFLIDGALLCKIAALQ